MRIHFAPHFRSCSAIAGSVATREPFGPRHWGPRRLHLLSNLSRWNTVGPDGKAAEPPAWNLRRLSGRSTRVWCFIRLPTDARVFRRTRRFDIATGRSI